MTIVAEQYAYVAGVDTHARTHTYAVLLSATGKVADAATFPTTGSVLVSMEGASS